MIGHRISDWDDAYANGAHIAGAERWPAAWIEPARDFREAMLDASRAQLDLAYGGGRRQRLDLFLPQGTPRGVVFYIHGGYWRAFDKSVWSHLAAGSVAHGFAVAMPSYTLCPEVRISAIVAEIAAALIHAATLIDGPLLLTGHSAGGHLATRMLCADAPLPAALRARIRNTVSISGLHDLRPLMRTKMNTDLRLDEAEAAAHSPALLVPHQQARLVCWVGAAERPEFIRQNELLANIWTGLGIEAFAFAEPDRHHFSVIEGLVDPEHPLTRTLLTG